MLAIKGAPGNRPVIERAGTKTKTGARLWIVGVDTVKAQLFGRLPHRSSFRFSAELPEVWFEQVASERQVLRYRAGQPIRSFIRVPGRRAEALDCLCYAIAARQIVTFDPAARRGDLATLAAPVARRAPVLRSEWMSR